MSPANAAAPAPAPAPAPPPPPPPPLWEPAGPFDMWRDYLGLAALVAALPRDPPGDAPPAATPGPPCAFCRHNGEAPAVYRGHSLRDAGGRLQCPVLRSYVCPQCGATQDRAHTRRFCPLTRRGYTSVYVRQRPGDTGAKRAAKGGKK